MGTRSKKQPGLDLPPIIVGAIRDYLGRRQANKLSSAQQLSISNIAASCAGLVAQVLEDETQVGQITHQPVKIGLEDD